MPERMFLCAALAACLCSAQAAQCAPAPPRPAGASDPAPVVAPDRTDPPEGVAYPAGSIEVSPTGTPDKRARSGETEKGRRPSSSRAPGAASVTAPTAAPTAAEAGPAESAPPAEGVMGRALACIRQRAPAAAAAEASAKLAVDLLIEDLCAPEMARAALYQRNIDLVVRYGAQTERGRAGLSSARVDPDTGEIINPPEDAAALSDVSGRTGAFDIPPALRRAAAVTVMAARTRPAAISRPAPAKRP